MTKATLIDQIISLDLEWMAFQAELRDVPDKLKPFMVSELDFIESSIGFARARLKLLRDMPTL